MKFTVLIPTHNPDPVRLGSVLDSLQAQTLDTTAWECVLIDNASRPPVESRLNLDTWTFPVRVINELRLGLTFARQAGLQATRSSLVVLLDDDNVLAPDYLEQASTFFEKEADLGAVGGKSLPRYEFPPDAWVSEFENLLALRDLGEDSLRAKWAHEYPPCSPIGAGMVLRRVAAQSWLDLKNSNLPDRQGSTLSSGGDNDIVLSLLKAGWQVGYEPTLLLTHLIPATRVDPGYLAQLNYGIQKSWMQVLHHHGINPWSPIPGWTVLPRKIRAWFRQQAWKSPVHYILWRGICGQFEGLAHCKIGK